MRTKQKTPKPRLLKNSDSDFLFLRLTLIIVVTQLRIHLCLTVIKNGKVFFAQVKLLAGLCEDLFYFTVRSKLMEYFYFTVIILF